MCMEEEIALLEEQLATAHADIDRELRRERVERLLGLDGPLADGQ